MDDRDRDHDREVSAPSRPANTAFLADVDEQLAQVDLIISTHHDHQSVGSALLERALLRQGADDPSIPASDASAALRRLRRTDRRDEAALAAAVAAGMTFRTDDIEGAVDLAVDAMILLDGHDRSGLAARALNALSILFSQISAFEQAMDFSLRAVDALGDDSERIGDIVRYTLCTLVIDASHAGVLLPLENARWALEMLSRSNEETTRHLVAPAVEAELTMIEHPERAHTIRLDLPELHIAAPRLASWLHVVSADLLHRRGEHRDAAALLDRAIPSLATLRDDHRLVRAYDLRSRVRDELGDHAGALADARTRGDTLRSWQTRRVGRLAWQIAQRAELERSQERLRLRATELAEEIDVDTLTGVGSRRLLEMTLDELAVDQPGDVAVVVIDLDHFKRINDTFGHSAGDAVLRRVGEVLRDSARSDDLIARLGGEEFVAVFPGAGTDRALEYADEVRARLAASDWDDIATGARVRASAGVAAGQLSDVRRVLDRADDALYEAKRRGRDRSVTARPLS